MRMMMKNAGWYTLDEREVGSAVVRVKAVPGSRREEIAGVLGDRLKVRVSAPPEKGKANEAIVGLMARELGIAARCVEVTQGQTRAEKTLRIVGGGGDLGVKLDRLGAGAS